MSRYNDRFRLNPADLELIEQALESQVALHLRPVAGDSAAGEDDTVRRIRRLLGKLHNQKIFYSQANPDGIPQG